MPFKPGDKVWIARASPGQHDDAGLGTVFVGERRRLFVVIGERTFSPFSLDLRVVEDGAGVCMKNEKYWAWTDMLEYADEVAPGQMAVRLVQLNGVSRELGIDVAAYEQMGLDQLASHVLRQPAPMVSGTKNRVEGPDFCILTIGVAR